MATLFIVLWVLIGFISFLFLFKKEKEYITIENFLYSMVIGGIFGVFVPIIGIIVLLNNNNFFDKKIF